MSSSSDSHHSEIPKMEGKKESLHSALRWRVVGPVIFAGIVSLLSIELGLNACKMIKCFADG